MQTSCILDLLLPSVYAQKVLYVAILLADPLFTGT